MRSIPKNLSIEIFRYIIHNTYSTDHPVSLVDLRGARISPRDISVQFFLLNFFAYLLRLRAESSSKVVSCFSPYIYFSFCIYTQGTYEIVQYSVHKLRDHA